MTNNLGKAFVSLYIRKPSVPDQMHFFAHCPQLRPKCKFIHKFPEFPMKAKSNFTYFYCEKSV